MTGERPTLLRQELVPPELPGPGQASPDGCDVLPGTRWTYGFTYGWRPEDPLDGEVRFDTRFGGDPAGEPPPFRFRAREQEVRRENPDGEPVGALRIVLEVPGAAESAAGESDTGEGDTGEGPPAPWIDVEDPVWQREPEDLEGGTAFVYRHRDTGRLLSAEEGRERRDRRFRLPDLDLLASEDARAVLFPGEEREVGFAEPLAPVVWRPEPFDLASVAAGPPPCEPLDRPLREHLEALYTALFAGSGLAESVLQLVVHYEYYLAEPIRLPQVPIVLPVFLIPTTLVRLGEGRQGMPLAEFVEAQAEGIETWYRAHRPPARRARLVLALKVMSSRAPRPAPILSLSDLGLALERIVPPLGL